MNIPKFLALKIILLVILAALAGAAFWLFNASREKTQLEAAETSKTKDNAQIDADGGKNGAPDSIIPSSQNQDKQSEAVNLSGSKDQNEEKPADDLSESERFVVSLDTLAIDQVGGNLLEQGFIKDKTAFIEKFGAETDKLVIPGGYKLAKNMDLLRIVAVLRKQPYMKWVVIPEGLRKEEIAELLGNTLGWTSAQKTEWISVDTAVKPEYLEGVYFPDTYLIPVDETPAKVAERLRAKFNEKFSIYLPEFSAQNIKWTTGLTLASIVQREAAGQDDMPLIAGILWNRLEQGMALNADATLQYARGDIGGGWWAQISASDKLTDTPYNTYRYKGLPPHPICNPGIAAVEAVLNPAQTDCLYYLHDSRRVTHCANAYEEHLANIEKYLKTE
jgi:UPF0755 protein